LIHFYKRSFSDLTAQLELRVEDEIS